MSKINIQISGVSAELVLGNYMPKDSTIYNDWMEFFHFNDLIHETQLLTGYVTEIEIKQDDIIMFKGKSPTSKFLPINSYSPVLVHHALYLRTECAENAVYQCEFDTDHFDKNKLFFETQDYDLLFKVGNSFICNVLYDHIQLPLEWISGHTIGDICLLCRFEDGYLIPVYDAIKKIAVL